MSASVEAVQAAFVSGDRAGLRLLLHPFAVLDGLDDVPAPRSIELRDGQVYRWSA